MKFEQPDLLGLEVTPNQTNSIKAIEVAQDLKARKKELRKRSAQRPPEERVRTKRVGVKAPATISDWQDRADVGFKNEE